MTGRFSERSENWTVVFSIGVGKSTIYGKGGLNKLPCDHGETLYIQDTRRQHCSLYIYTYVVDKNNAFKRFVQCLTGSLKIQSLLLFTNKLIF